MWWNRQVAQDAIEMDRIQDRLDRLDAMPVESQTYADLEWYEWAIARSNFLHDRLYDEQEEPHG